MSDSLIETLEPGTEVDSGSEDGFHWSVTVDEEAFAGWVFTLDRTHGVASETEVGFYSTIEAARVACLSTIEAFVRAELEWEAKYGNLAV